MRITKLSRDSDCLSGRSFFLCFCTKTYDTDFIQKKHKMFIKWNMKWICVRVAYVMVIQFGFVPVCCVYVCVFNGNAFFNEKDFQEFHFCFCHRKVLFNWNEMKNSHFINENFLFGMEILPFFITIVRCHERIHLLKVYFLSNICGKNKFHLEKEENTLKATIENSSHSIVVYALSTKNEWIIVFFKTTRFSNENCVRLNVNRK